MIGVRVFRWSGSSNTLKKKKKNKTRKDDNKMIQLQVRNVKKRKQKLIELQKKIWQPNGEQVK